MLLTLVLPHVGLGAVRATAPAVCEAFVDACNSPNFRLQKMSLTDHPTFVAAVVPSFSSRMASLRYLDLSGGLALTACPDLSQLAANGLKIENVPAHLSGWESNGYKAYDFLTSGCTKLDFSHFRGHDLPGWISELSSLQTLNLEYCVSLTGLPDLSTLVASGLKVENVPTHLSQWRAIGFKQYNFTTDPAGLAGCTALDLSHFRGVELPHLIGELTSLRSVDLRDCINLASLPDSICALESLQTLKLHNCKGLTSLPDLSSLVDNGLAIDGAPKEWADFGFTAWSKT
jgi:Leucine-rich repeat (LRR) protein